MILRRLKAHVEKENWFAVAIDFCIVVVGVFIGIQVANWNAVRQDGLSEVQYLERFADEITLTLAHIEEERAFATEALGKIEAFTQELYNPEASDNALVELTHDYLSEGAFFANFQPSRTTFDDLVSTGNIDIIQDPDIRTGLISLHVSYGSADNAIESNITWLNQGEDRIYYDFDAFRYDGRTGHLFDDLDHEVMAKEIYEHRETLRRHAAFHYWLKTRSIELYDEVQPQAEAVLDRITAKLQTAR